jgi:hypothetical protein
MNLEEEKSTINAGIHPEAEEIKAAGIGGLRDASKRGKPIKQVHYFI